MLGNISSWFGSSSSASLSARTNEDAVGTGSRVGGGGENAPAANAVAGTPPPSASGMSKASGLNTHSARKGSLGFFGIDATTAAGLKNASLAMLKTVTSEAAAAIEDGIAACVNVCFHPSACEGNSASFAIM